MMNAGDVNAHQATQEQNVKRKITLCKLTLIGVTNDQLTSRPFAIIVFSTIFLMVMAGGSVMLLMTIGDTKLPSTLNLAIGTNMKRD
jgi:ATP-dependent Clp protease adapter protein ClpS